jgi:hypothetical protein
MSEPKNGYGSIWATPEESIWATESPAVPRWNAEVLEFPVPKWNLDPHRQKALAEQAMRLAIVAKAKLRRI